MEKQNMQSIQTSPINVTAALNPFTTIKKSFLVFNRTSIYQILIELGESPNSDLLVFINDVKIDKAFWRYTYPKKDSYVTIKSAAAGGETGRLLATLAVTAAATFVVGPYFAGPGLAGALAGAGAATATMAVGMLAINALIPLPTEKFAKETESAVLSITGARNSEKPFSPIPQVLGYFQYTPPLAASSYVSTNGNNQDLTMLMTPGYGPLELSNFRIGNKDLATFSDYSMEYRAGYSDDAPITIFPKLTDQKLIDIRLWNGVWAQGDGVHPEPNPNPPNLYVYTTNIPCYKFTIDIIFPYGLITIKNQGDRQSRTVFIKVEYSPTGAGAWVEASGSPFNFTETTDTMLRKTIDVTPTLTVPDVEEIFDVRVSRLTGDDREGLDPDGDNTRYSSSYWKYLTAFSNEEPLGEITQGLCLSQIALNIKATDQLSGNIEDFNCLCKTICLDYDDTTDGWILRASNNPASLFRHVLQCTANKNAIPDCRVDLIGLKNFHIWCKSRGYTFNSVRDFSSTVIDTLRDVAAAGRGRPAHLDGKWGVVWDEQALYTPVQLFTPRNMNNFSASKQFIDTPHAFRVRYVDADNDYKQTEKIFYDEDAGYDNTNASIFESIEFPGLTNETENKTMAQYELAVARLRQEVFTWETDIEQIVCTQGDAVLIQHDAIKIGVGAGRIVSLTSNSITLDITVIVPASPKIWQRSSTGGLYSANVTTLPATETRTLTLDTDPTLTAAIGDLVTLGESTTITKPIVIKDIRPKNDFAATLVGYDIAPSTDIIPTP